MSDLQCPARILLATPEAARAASDALAADHHVVRTLRSETGPDLAQLADEHRGETVLVISATGPHVDRGHDVVLVEIDADGWRVTDLSRTVAGTLGDRFRLGKP